MYIYVYVEVLVTRLVCGFLIEPNNMSISHFAENYSRYSNHKSTDESNEMLRFWSEIGSED